MWALRVVCQWYESGLSMVVRVVSGWRSKCKWGKIGGLGVVCHWSQCGMSLAQVVHKWW